MANCPPLKSCCSLCLASLLSFTIATGLATPVRPQEQTRQESERKETRTRRSGLYGRSRERRQTKVAIPRPEPASPLGGPACGRRKRCWFSSLGGSGSRRTIEELSGFSDCWMPGAMLRGFLQPGTPFLPLTASPTFQFISKCFLSNREGTLRTEY